MEGLDGLVESVVVKFGSLMEVWYGYYYEIESW